MILFLLGFGIWIASSIVMMFFVPVLELFDVNDDGIICSVAFAPIMIPCWFIIFLFWAAYKLGEMVFG